METHRGGEAAQVPITFPGPVAGSRVAAAVLVGVASAGVGGTGVLVGVDVSVGRVVAVGAEVGVWLGVCVGLAVDVGVGVGGRGIGVAGRAVGVAGAAQADRATRARRSSVRFI